MAAITCALALAVTAASQGRATGPDMEPRAALVRAPLQASSPGGALSVVLVESVANAAAARSVGALVAARGDLVRWVALPLEELPDALVVPDAHTIHCVTADDRVLTFDVEGRPVGAARLDDLLPVAGARDPGQPVGFAYDARGVSLAVPLLCGRLALVEFHPADPEPYGVCTLIRPTRLVCGAEAWLEQARELTRQGDRGAALYALESAVAASPEDPRCYRELARFHDRSGDAEGRLACLRTGMERLFARAGGAVDEQWRVGTPEARLALEYVAASREAHGAAGAERALDLALGLYPCLSEAVLLRAELRLERGDEPGALAVLEDTLARLAPECLASAHHDVGRFLRRHGHTRGAIRFLEDAYALGERSEFLLRALAELSEEDGDPARAAEWLETLRRAWHGIDNGSTAPERDARWARRLDELDQEIARLAALAATSAIAER